jgi:predicted nuclease of restriction endonuclease-like (RecB) superfamily
MVRKRSTEGKNENRNALGRRRKDAMFPVATTRAGLPSDYAGILLDLKQRIQRERLRTVMAANSAMVLLYWDIGRTILERQDREGWGARVIDRLSTDLREAFPDMKGLSPRNLKYMRAFATVWPDRAIVQEALAQITWYHNIALLEKLDNPQTRLWYAKKVRETGWSPGATALEQCHSVSSSGRDVRRPLSPLSPFPFFLLPISAFRRL